MSLGMGLYCVHFVYLCVRVIVGGARERLLLQCFMKSVSLNRTKEKEPE